MGLRVRGLGFRVPRKVRNRIEDKFPILLLRIEATALPIFGLLPYAFRAHAEHACLMLGGLNPMPINSSSV